MPDGDQVRRMFHGIAGRYDRLNHLLSFGLDRWWWNRMAHHAGARPGLRFLDVAAGTGDSSVALARRGAEVVSTDFTHAMLVRGAAKVQALGLQGRIWACVEADAQHLPFREATFDGVTICYGIRNVENRSLAYRECLRVLVPGGRLTILEFSTPLPVLRPLYAFYNRFVLPRVGGWISGDPEAYAYLPESIRHFPDGPSLAQELEGAGFEAVRWKRLSGGIVALHTGRKPTQINVKPIAKQIDGMIQ